MERIRYSIVPCALGHLAVAATERGIRAVRLGDDPNALEADLVGDLTAALPARDDEGLVAWTRPLQRYLEGATPLPDLPTDVPATPFQRLVWQTLREIPCGATRSYSQVAAAIGRPKAARAVAGACAANPVAIVVPCHRVVRSDGGLGGYRWGVERKRRLLEQEADLRAKKTP